MRDLKEVPFHPPSSVVGFRWEVGGRGGGGGSRHHHFPATVYCFALCHAIHQNQGERLFPSQLPEQFFFPQLLSLTGLGCLFFMQIFTQVTVMILLCFFRCCCSVAVLLPLFLFSKLEDVGCWFGFRALTLTPLVSRLVLVGHCAAVLQAVQGGMEKKIWPGQIRTPLRLWSVGASLKVFT